MKKGSKSSASKKSKKSNQKETETPPTTALTRTAEAVRPPGMSKGDENDKTAITFHIPANHEGYLSLKNNNGMFMTFTESQLEVCVSIIKKENFNCVSVSDGVEMGGFWLKNGSTESCKFGILKLSPKTVKPYEISDADIQASLIVIKGQFIVRSTAFYELNGVKYLHGETMKAGDIIVIPPCCAYTLENWSDDEECLLGYTSIITYPKI